VFALACLTVWGLAFPMTLTAYAQTNQDFNLPPTTSPMMLLRRVLPPPTSSVRVEPREAKGDLRMLPPTNTPKMRPAVQLFKNSAQQKLAKRKVEALVVQLNQFKKQIAQLSAQGITVPSTISTDVDTLLSDIKALGQAVSEAKTQSSATAQPPTVPTTQ